MEESMAVSLKRKACSSDERKALYREKVRVNEQQRRSRSKAYFTVLKGLLPADVNKEEMTKEEILQQILQNRNVSDVPKQVPLSQKEVSELFTTVHRDAFFKISRINSISSFAESKAVLDYLSDLGNRSEDAKHKINAGMSQVALNAFIFYNPVRTRQIFETLIPLYESFVGNQVFRFGLVLGDSEWILPAYALVLASQGHFDKSMIYEQRALRLAETRPETAGHVYACLYFIRYFRGENITIQEAIEAYNSMKDLPHLKDYARLAFAYGLLLQSTTVQEMMEAKTIIDNAQDAIHACPFFEFHLRVMFIEIMIILNPERALVDVDTAMVLSEIKGKSGCFTKADFCRIKADVLLRIPKDEFNSVKAEELYKEAVTISASEGLYSCTLKAATALCKLYKAQHRRSEGLVAGRYLMELVKKLEGHNQISCVVMKKANDVLRDFVKFKQ